MNFRKNDYPSNIIEVVTPLLIWSIVFERVGPSIFGKGVSDPLIVIAYFVGGILYVGQYRIDIACYLLLCQQYPATKK